MGKGSWRNLLSIWPSFQILITFSIPLYTGLFIGYTVTALSIEFNTIFLHLRFMFVFHEYDKRKLVYRVISTANLGKQTDFSSQFSNRQRQYRLGYCYEQ